MRPDEITTQQPPIPEGPEMLEAMREGVLEALNKHQDEGVSIITWDRQAKRTVEIPADQIDAWIRATGRDS